MSWHIESLTRRDGGYIEYLVRWVPPGQATQMPLYAGFVPLEMLERVAVFPNNTQISFQTLGYDGAPAYPDPPIHHNLGAAQPFPYTIAADQLQWALANQPRALDDWTVRMGEVLERLEQKLPLKAQSMGGKNDPNDPNAQGCSR